MVRIKLTWRSWMRSLSLRAWGGAAAALLLLGTGITVAQQQGPVIIQRGPRPPAPVVQTQNPPVPIIPVTTTPAPPVPPVYTPPAPVTALPPAPTVAPPLSAAPPAALNLPDPFTPPLPGQPTMGLPPLPATTPSSVVPAPVSGQVIPDTVTGQATPSSPYTVLNLVVPASYTPPPEKPVVVPPPMPVGWTTKTPAGKVDNPPSPPEPVAPKLDGNTPLPPAPKLDARTPLPPPPKPEVKPPPAEVRFLPPPPLPALQVAPPPVRVETPVMPPVAPRPVAGTLPPGATPITTPEVQREYGQFVKNVVDPQTTLDLAVGRTRLMVLASTPQRIQVGEEKTLTCEQVSPTELSLKAKAVGTTVLNLWFADPVDSKKHKILSYLVRVYPDPQTKERLQGDYKALADEINRAFPDSQVSLSTVGDKLAVSGQAKDVAQAAQILRIVRAHAPADLGSSANENPTVHSALSPAQADDASSDGPAPTAQQLLQAAGPNVVNLLHVPGEQQVMLRVTVAEVNRAAARTIGLNCSVERHDGVTVFASRTAQLAGMTDMGGASVPVFLDNGQIGLAIHALRGMNLAKTIEEPHLAALNGHCAKFSAGGKFPVPSPGGVSFIPYGVSLSFTPYVLDRDCIRLNLQAEVSTKDVASTVNVNCTPVPGLNSRTFQTTVELREGQTMAIAGLIQNNLGAASHGTPGLCDIPGVGRLFGGEITSTSEQELIVLITPELVHPLECKDAPPVPGCDLIEPSDLEFYLMGHLQGHCGDLRGPVRLDPAQLKRASHCEDLFLSGPQGYSNGRE